MVLETFVVLETLLLLVLEMLVLESDVVDEVTDELVIDEVSDETSDGKIWTEEEVEESVKEDKLEDEVEDEPEVEGVGVIDGDEPAEGWGETPAKVDMVRERRR